MQGGGFKRKEDDMRKVVYSNMVIEYYDESDLAECRACHVKPELNGRSSDGSRYLRCPVCGIKTGSSTSGLEGLLPVWNAVMDDAWPESDPKRC